MSTLIEVCYQNVCWQASTCTQPHTHMHSTAVCVDLAKSDGKAVHMNIIMCRASYSGWIALDHIILFTCTAFWFLGVVLQGLGKQLHCRPNSNIIHEYFFPEIGSHFWLEADTDKLQHSEESPIFSSSYSTGFIVLAAAAPLQYPKHILKINGSGYFWILGWLSHHADTIIKSVKRAVGLKNSALMLFAGG